MFNPDLLIELIKKAQGHRSLNTFARECDIDPGNLSRILNNKKNFAPKPETLIKIAINSDSNVTYNELMLAAGYVPLSEGSHNDKKTFMPSDDNIEIENTIDALTDYLLEKQDGLMLSGSPLSQDALDSLIETITLGMKQAKLINKNSPK